jgi:hypothetical protein
VPTANKGLKVNPNGAIFGVVFSSVASWPALPALSPLVDPVADGEAELEDDEEDGDGGGLGQGFLYTNCSGFPLQVPAAPASYVPFGYIQHVPSAYGEPLGLWGLKTA